MHSQIVNELYISSCINAIEACDVGQPVFRSRGLLAIGDEIEAPSKGSIVGEATMGFSGKLSDQNKSDAQNALLFATRAANKLYPEEHQGVEWYKRFREVMTLAGWTPVDQYYNNLGVEGTSVRMDKLVLEILASVLANVALPGPTSVLMLNVAGDAISALQKRDTAALTAYERNLLDHGVGGISTGACVELDGEAIMALGTVRFLRKNTSTKVMFVDVDVRNVSLYRAQTFFAKNTDVANAVRETIKKKLVGIDQIEDIDIS
ncbi:hypothetical protein LOY52_03100 [Pseudomonas sp. B21-051]|uniref:hypothetical protein n=1 Tax=Pseudomonas sp. B21-051 TaxID=2895491 RepID=UPI0021603AFF|nr:hypothetical protein [Pseudomonas sp. B21-051]UVK89068.1 hypothetical protein LOY52_03100 [Pseudomonas sp. B21-051]